MRRRGTTAARLVSVALLVAALASCGGDPADESATEPSPTKSTEATPAVCDDLDALTASVKKLQGVTMDRDALPVVAATLRDIQAEVRQLADDASAEYADEIKTVKAQGSDLAVSVKAASSAPSADTVSAVLTNWDAFRASVQDLGTAVSTSC